MEKRLNISQNRKTDKNIEIDPIQLNVPQIIIDTYEKAVNKLKLISHNVSSHTMIK